MSGGAFYFDREWVTTHLRRRTYEHPGDRQHLWDLCLSQAGLAPDKLYAAPAGLRPPEPNQARNAP